MQVNGLNSSHYEVLLACGASLDDVLALASAVADLRGVDDTAPDTDTERAPTMPSPVGLCFPSPVKVVVARERRDTDIDLYLDARAA